MLAYEKVVCTVQWEANDLIDVLSVTSPTGTKLTLTIDHSRREWDRLSFAEQNLFSKLTPAGWDVQPYTTSLTVKEMRIFRDAVAKAAKWNQLQTAK